jgi:hypothetical protein
MNAMEQLNALAQIAATYSGFIAVFLAFVPKEGRFATSDAHFVQAMVLGTIGTMMLALAPAAMSLIVPERTVWFDMTLFALIAGIPSTGFQAWQQAREAADKSDKTPVFWHVPGWVLGLSSLACFIAAMAQPEVRAGYYVAGVSLSLAISIWCFIAVVFRKFF